MPRIVDVLPHCPRNHPTVRVFLAGGVPEVMLHLRRAGLLDERCLTVSGEPLGKSLDWWEGSERRTALRARLRAADGVDPDDVIMSQARARERGLTSTVTFPRGNLAPEGSVIRARPSIRAWWTRTACIGNGPALRLHHRSRPSPPIKSQGPERLKPGDILVLICRGPLGAGMEEIYQITAALKHLSWGKQVAVITDARFSGVSTGACVGHVGPEALAGGPVGKVIEGDRIRIIVDRNRLEGSLDLIGHDGREYDPEEGARVLAARAPRPDLAPDPDLPDDTRLWAVLQQAGGGTWGGCVYDVGAVTAALASARGAERGPAGRAPGEQEEDETQRGQGREHGGRSHSCRGGRPGSGHQRPAIIPAHHHERDARDHAEGPAAEVVGADGGHERPRCPRPGHAAGRTRPASVGAGIARSSHRGACPTMHPPRWRALLKRSPAQPPESWPAIG